MGFQVKSAMGDGKPSHFEVMGTNFNLYLLRGNTVGATILVEGNFETTMLAKWLWTWHNSSVQGGGHFVHSRLQVKLVQASFRILVSWAQIISSSWHNRRQQWPGKVGVQQLHQWPIIPTEIQGTFLFTVFEEMLPRTPTKANIARYTSWKNVGFEATLPIRFLWTN